MKVILLGGSSLSTPSLFRYLASVVELPPTTLVLAGRDSARLAAVARVAAMFVPDPPITIETVKSGTDAYYFALDGADVVVIQLRVGGFQGRVSDESLAVVHGVCGDENLGPSAVSAAWRAWPTIRDHVETIARIAPRAVVLMLSSPVSLLVRLALSWIPSLRTLGICELPLTTLDSICSALRVSRLAAEFQYLGINHAGWFDRIELQGRDLIAEYAARDRDEFPSAELISECGAIPTKYLQLHYEPEVVLARQRSRTNSRGAQLERIARDVFPVFESGDREAIERALKRRPAPWYTHALGPLVVGLSRGGDRGVSGPFFLTTRNAELVPEFGSSDVLEIPHSLHRAQLQPTHRTTPAPRTVLELLRQFVEGEAMAADAVLTGSPTALERALAVHPWIQSLSLARVLASEIRAAS